MYEQLLWITMLPYVFDHVKISRVEFRLLGLISISLLRIQNEYSTHIAYHEHITNRVEPGIREIRTFSLDFISGF